MALYDSILYVFFFYFAIPLLVRGIAELNGEGRKLPTLFLFTGGVQIIGRNSRFIGYFVTKTKKNTEKIPEDSRLTQALSDSILFVSKFKVKIEEIRRSLTPPFAVLSAHIALYYRKQCFYERKA